MTPLSANAGSLTNANSLSLTQFSYDAASRQIAVTDPLGNTTEYAYDNLDRLISTTQPDPDGGGSLTAPVTSFTYDLVGNLLSLTDPVGNETTWVYDNLNRATSETNELSEARTFKYDAVSNLVEKIDRLGRKTTWEYDNLYRNTSEKWWDGTTLVRTLSFAYDAASQLASASDPAATYSYGYDGLGRVTGEGQTLAGLTPDVQYASEFDANSRRTALQSVIGGDDDFLNTYSYDNLNRLTRLEQGSGADNVVAEKRIDFAYNAASQFAQIDRYADVAGTEFVASSFYSYDGLGRLSKLTHNESNAFATGWGNNPLAGYAFTYDAGSRITSIDSYVDGLTEYGYDATNQLTDADHTGQTDESYAYDENGNRTGGSYSTGTNNRLTSDGTYNYTYDEEGNRLTKTKISNSEKEEYTWDHRNRLTKVTFKNSGGTVLKTVDQTYDIFNRWIKRSIDPDGATGSAAAVDTFFSHFGRQIALEFDGAAASDLSHRYLWNEAAVDQVVADEAVASLASAGEVLWALTDHLGTPRDLASYDSGTDTTTIANHRRYDSYGILVSETNSSINILFGFTGRPFDEATGLNNNWHRWFTFHVWLNEDPIGFWAGDANLNRYVSNSPTDSVDPSGLIDIGGTISGLAELQYNYYYGLMEGMLQRAEADAMAKVQPIVRPMTTATPGRDFAVSITRLYFPGVPPPEAFDSLDTCREDYDSFRVTAARSATDPKYFNRMYGKGVGYHVEDAVVLVVAARITTPSTSATPAPGTIAPTAEVGGSVVSTETTAILKNGYYEVNGFKFSKYYYEKLWSTGRGGPSLVAKLILEGTGGKGCQDAIKQGFFRYEYGGWEMVYNPVTQEVWHLQPIGK